MDKKDNFSNAGSSNGRTPPLGGDYLGSSPSPAANSDIPSEIRAFGALPAEDQKGLISKMTLRDINRYAWYVKKELKPKFGSISKNAHLWVQQYFTPQNYNLKQLPMRVD